jgi:hypothetical protein
MVWETRMKTQALIDMLSQQDEQLQINPMNTGKWIFGGLVVSLLACVTALGVDNQWTTWLGTSKYWLKVAFGVATMLLALGLLLAGVVPGKRLPYAGLWLGLPTALALSALALTPTSAWASEVFRPMWATCAPSILLLALPIWAALVAIVKHQAPTELRYVGALMGAVAGGAAAAIYTLHCPEFSPLYIGVWYGSSIALSAAMSAAVAPRLLRW